MEKNQMKNIVVLKDLPSNLIEEAILIFKTNNNTRKFESIDKGENVNKEKNSKNAKDYIIKEAESVISNYISKTDKKTIKTENTGLNKRYRRLKIYSIIVTVALFISLIF